MVGGSTSYKLPNYLASSISIWKNHCIIVCVEEVCIATSFILFLSPGTGDQRLHHPSRTHGSTRNHFHNCKLLLGCQPLQTQVSSNSQIAKKKYSNKTPWRIPMGRAVHGILPRYMNGWLVGGFNPSAKIWIVKLDHFPKVRGESKKYLKPPPSHIHWTPPLSCL